MHLPNAQRVGRTPAIPAFFRSEDMDIRCREPADALLQNSSSVRGWATCRPWRLEFWPSARFGAESAVGRGPGKPTGHMASRYA